MKLGIVLMFLIDADEDLNSNEDDSGIFTDMFMYRNEQVVEKTSCSHFTCFLDRHYWIGSSKT